MTDFLMDLTELGNSLFLVTFALVLAIYLFSLGYRREPLAMVLGFLVPAASIGTLKIAFYTCASNIWGIVSPSGHAALSIGVFGISALILSKVCPKGWSVVVPVILTTLAIVIAISRTVLGMHTDGDVIIGSLIGFGAVAAIAKLVLSYPVDTTHVHTTIIKKQVHPLKICGLFLAVTVLLYGIKLPSEEIMKFIANEIRDGASVCS